ncbi:MAG TPA: hypothetical protein VJC09_00055 [Candidatus Saccharimonadales bacterium]|nr:hypothetical protein [Candidatus Saccharimonadales bacterium]
MKKLNKHELGFSVVEAVLIFVIFAVITTVGWYIWKSRQHTTRSDNKAESTAATTQSANPYSGWKTYTLKYDKLTFKYPADWYITASNNNYDTDFIEFTSPGDFHLSIADGQGHLGGDGLAFITSVPVLFAGQSVYIAYFGGFSKTTKDNRYVQSAIVVSDTSSQWSRPTNKNAMRKDEYGGKNITILMSHDSSVKKLTAETVKNDAEYKTAKFVIESMHY